MAKSSSSSILFNVLRKKCDHAPELRAFKAFSSETTFNKIESILRCHQDGFMEVSLAATEGGPWTKLEDDNLYDIPIGHIVYQFPGTKYVKLECLPEESESDVNETYTAKPLQKSADVMNAFEIMMKRTRVTLSKKNIKVLCNALWYITNQQNVINDCALRQKNVHPVPSAFDRYTGYNNMKRKKVKELPLAAQQLDSHSQALYSILLKPVVKSSAEWIVAGEEIKQLADCFVAYKNFLKVQSDKSAQYKHSEQPARTIDTHATLDHRQKTVFAVKLEYMLIDKVMKETELCEPVIFDEESHLGHPFDKNTQRFRFFENLQLSVPIDLIKFCPGGGTVTTHIIVKVQSDRSEAQILTDGARLLQKIKPHLKVCHSRAQRKAFKERLNNLTKISPAVADFIYKELAMDSSAAEHPVTQERLRLIFLGEKGLLTDLRKLNPGRPTGTYDTFFSNLGTIVEEKTAADERRHNVSHLSEWLSLEDLISKAAELCPPDTPVPSKSLVRLQFSPKNPYARVALNFTSKLSVQHKIQRRQLRLSHQDQHYCAAQLKYLKEKAVEAREEAVLVCCDDKAKVPVGEPGAPVSTGVMGKKSIATTSTTMCALDHDMTKISLTPSVVLQCCIPEKVDHSFVQGKVYTVINDSVFQQSNPFRHAAVLAKLLSTNKKKILMKFTDGGTDQRNNLEAVKCASICLFLELNLEMLIHARCAPGHSWTNPAERVMSILNIGLQNCALDREEGDEATEKELKKCGSMADIRAKATKVPEFKGKYAELIEPVQAVVRNRFSRLKLKPEPIEARDPVSETDIDLIKRHLREKFPDLDETKLQKVHTKKVKSYNEWLEAHCHERHYSFQIRRCNDSSCCLPSTLSEELLSWLPDPVLDDENPDHFKKYEQVKHENTTENARPSMKVNTEQKQTRKKKNDTHHEATRQLSIDTADQQDQVEVINASQEENVQTDDTEVNEVIEEPLFGEYSMCTTQNARTTVTCVECRKPRVLYSKHRLLDRQQVSLICLLSEFDYTCGAPITPPEHNLHGKVLTRANLSCMSSVEIPYYGSNFGRKDTCSFCGADQGIIDPELKKKYKSVLPLCDNCKEKGNLPAVSRPYGKQ